MLFATKTTKQSKHNRLKHKYSLIIIIIIIIINVKKLSF